MEDPAFVDQAQVQLLKAQTGIRAGLPGKGKIPVAGFVQGDEGQGGEDGIVRHQAPGPDPGLLKRGGQQAAEGVGAHLAQQRGGRAEAGQGRQEIGRRAAGMGRHGGIAVGIDGNGGEVDQQFAQCSYIDHNMFTSIRSDFSGAGAPSAYRYRRSSSSGVSRKPCRAHRRMTASVPATPTAVR